MATAQRFYLFIPTYNVAGRAIEVLDSIPEETLSKFTGVLIIDNGSLDETRPLLQEWVRARDDPKIRLFFNEQNYSLGGSTIIAIREAIKGNGDFLVCLHSDGQADPGFLPQFLERSRPEVDFVLGNRFADRSLSPRYSAARWWGNLFFEKLQNLISGQKLGDIGAYISFNLQTLKRIPYWALPHDMGYQPLLILSVAQFKEVRVDSFPITWGEADLTNVNPFRYGIAHFGKLLGVLVGRVPKGLFRLEDFKTVEVLR